MDRLASLAERALRKVRRHGIGRALYAACLKACGRQWLQVLRGHYVEEVNPAFLDTRSPYSAAFLTPRALEQFARDPQAGFSEPFVRQALAKGDKCYGFTHEGALRAYGWYATNPTRISPELTIHFAPGYVYIYKGFTHEQHRGRRLYPAGMTRALRHYRSIGYKGMLAYVDATNLDSLKSCARMGFRVFGSIYVVRLLGRCFAYSSPGCARFSFRVEPICAARLATHNRRPGRSYP
jgi:GNAT superfamily N-acetyltransferase